MNTINKIRNYLKEFILDKTTIRTLIIYVCLPIILNIIIEILSRKSITKGFAYIFNRPIPFLCGVLIILMTLMISVFFKRRLFCVSLISFLWLLLGFGNYVLLSNRVTPFNGTDLLLMQPAIAVITKYYTVFTIALVIIGILLIFCFIVLMWFKAPKLKYKINYLRNSIITALIVILTLTSISLAIQNGALAVKFDNIANAYKKYGFAYCFSNSVFNTGIKKPDDYCAQKIEEIITETTQEEAIEVSTSVSSPNIIFLQLESFFDISRFKDLVLSQNPIPNFTNLKAEFPTGFFGVPTVGAGTANTEFEVLTGMNLYDFGPGEYPYKTVLQSTTSESISYNLKANGYSTHAIHNNDGTFYQRHTVFSQLGFDTFTSVEYMNVLEYTAKNWAKDKVLTGEILKCLTSTPESDFVYTISVEGHGSYPGNEALVNPQIQVQQIGNEAKRNAVEYYVNLLYSMDQFIAELIATLSAYNEDVILVMYGDHLPSLGISNDQLNSGTTLQTEYIIWNNMNLQIDNEDVEAYQMSSKILELIGIDTGIINKYHQTHKNSEEYLNGLQNLEYDLLYGDLTAYNGVNPFIATKIQMGIDKIKINEILIDDTNPGYIYLKGENFTAFSVAYINEKAQKTEFIDTSTLKVEYNELQYQDAIKVGQQGSDNVVLSYTDEFIIN